MQVFHTLLILLAVALTVFAEAVFNVPRRLLGAQVDLLPGLMVYVSLSCGLNTMVLVAFTGGLMFDSLSANPLGISVLPLFLVGLFIQQYRVLILRDQTYAQLVLGLGASAAVPVMTLLLMINTGATPVLGWYSLWQWFVMSLLGGLATPLWFRVFGRALRDLTYQPLPEGVFRDNREIKRGRN